MVRRHIGDVRGECISLITSADLLISAVLSTRWHFQLRWGVSFALDLVTLTKDVQLNLPVMQLNLWDAAIVSSTSGSDASWAGAAAYEAIEAARNWRFTTLQFLIGSGI